MTQTFLITGEPGSGKTSYIKALMGNAFTEKYRPTKGLVKYEFDLETTEGLQNFQFFECVSEEDCLPKSRSVDYILEFISPEEVQDTLEIERETIKKDFPNLKNYIIVVSKADLLPPSTRRLLEEDPNVVVLSTQENYNVYEPIERALNENKSVFGPYLIFITGPGKVSWLGQMISGVIKKSDVTSYEADLDTNKGKFMFIILACSEEICKALSHKADGIIQIITPGKRAIKFDVPDVEIESKGKGTLPNDTYLLENSLLNLSRQISEDPTIKL